MRNFNSFYCLTEGGNLSIDGKYFADDINLDYITSEKATKFVEDLENLFREINKIYQTEFGEPLWAQLETLLRTNKIYSGSSKIFVQFVKEGKFEQFAKYKKKMGDIDIQFDEEFAEQFNELFHNKNTVLANVNSPKRVGNFTFYGEGGTGVIQMNTLFGYKFGVNMDTGDDDKEKITFVQIDFEPVSFERGIPTKFSQFSHSASFEDMEKGIKGVFHKFLLQVLNDVSNKISVDFKTYSFTGREIKKKSIKNSAYAFSVDRGFRDRYVPLLRKQGDSEILVNDRGELVYLDINSADKEKIKQADYRFIVKNNSQLGNDLQNVQVTELDNFSKVLFVNPDTLKYSQNLEVLFELIFGKIPDESDMKGFESFSGLLELMKKQGSNSNLANKERDIYNNFIDKLYSPQAQLLYKRDSLNPKGEIHQRDFDTKQAALNMIQDYFPNSTVDFPQAKFQNLITQYYNIK